MKIFGLSAAAIVVRARHPELHLVNDGGQDLAEAAPFAIFPESATHAERLELEIILRPRGWLFQAASVVSALGIVRLVDVRLPNVLALQRDLPVTVLSLRGWREWSAAHVARGLRTQGYEARVVEMQMHGSHVDAGDAQVAARFDDLVFRTNLLSALAGAKQVLLPPVLGASKRALELSQVLGAEVGEAIGLSAQLASEAQLAGVKAAEDAQKQLAAAWSQNEQMIVASRRCALWLEEEFLVSRPHDARYPNRNALACGRARGDCTSLGDEWLTALRLAASIPQRAANTEVA